MRFNRTKDISVGLVKFDGWDVLLGAGVAILVIHYTVHGTPWYLNVIWIVLLALWLVMVFLVNLGIVPKNRGHGAARGASKSGSASASGGESGSGASASGKAE